MLIAATWEVLENTPSVIDTYRELPAGAGYSGDSVIRREAANSDSVES